MSRPEPKPVVYCLIPPAGAEWLEEVRAYYAEADPRVEVIVDRRIAQRRRRPDDADPPGPDRRGGTDRRRFVVPRRLRALPPELEERTGRVRWVQRLLPVSDATERLSTAEVVDAVRAGDSEAPTELYWRFYERLHSRLCVLLSDQREADAAVVRAFGRLLDALDDPRTADHRVEDLLYMEADACATDVLERRGATHDMPTSGLGLQDPELDEAVRLREFDVQWTGRARAERDRLLERLSDRIIGIEHIGSTAVANVGGRNIIDLLAGVHRMPPPEEVLETLEGAGYEECGDAGTPGRVYLRRRGRLRVDLHVVEYGGALWQDGLAMREYLRRHPEEAMRWGAVKRDAARTMPTSAHRYFDLRRLVLDELLERARREAHIGNVPYAA